MTQPLTAVAHCQRWRARREAYVPSRSRIRPGDFAVDVIEERQAKAFVVEHHYSGTFPASRLSAGLFWGRSLVGVATFSVPMNELAVPKHTGLADPLRGVELGRFVLLDDVPGNGESWFLARAFGLLRRRKPEIEAVISYADPVPRLGAAGEVIKPGHVGTIYQALSAAYRGRATARTEYLTPDGQPFSGRAASKIRAEETGHAYAVDELVRRGAPRPGVGQDLRTWYADLLASGFFVRRRHPGNHVYAFPLTRGARKAALAAEAVCGLKSLPYPKAAA